MKAVYQTIIDPINGNCWPACLASILEIDIDIIPNFCKDKNPNWWADTQKWLDDNGYFAIEVVFGKPGEVSPYSAFPDGAFVILTGPSTMFDNTQHAVVGKIKITSPDTQQVEFIHDPNRHSKSQYIKHIENMAIIGKKLTTPPSGTGEGRLVDADGHFTETGDLLHVLETIKGRVLEYDKNPMGYLLRDVEYAIRATKKLSQLQAELARLKGAAHIYFDTGDPLPLKQALGGEVDK